jgi:hypothetical protein
MNEMLSATKNLAAVRQAVCALMDEDTIMIGHGWVGLPVELRYAAGTERWSV